MSPHDRMDVDLDILGGKPVVNGTRLSVDFLLGLLGQGWPEAEILRNYPGLQREDLLACWAYASEVLRDPTHPWLAFAGMFKDDLDFQEVVKIIAENRRKIDEEQTVP